MQTAAAAVWALRRPSHMLSVLASPKPTAPVYPVVRTHRNVMPIYNLIKLYDVPIAKVNALADAKYGVTYFCPGGGEYRYDAASDQVYSTVFGNRQNARQPLTVAEGTAFSDFIDTLKELTAALRFTDDGLLGTVEIVRREKQPADKK